MNGDEKHRRKEQRFYREAFGQDPSLSEINCCGSRLDRLFVLCRDCPLDGMVPQA